MPPNRATTLRLYRLMRLTRMIEDRVRALYYERKIVGGVYTSRGMEATAVGAADALRPGDVIVPLHRDLGALLARGITAREVFCQYLGRGNSLSHGRDGQLRVGDLRERMIVPTTSIVGSSLPVGVGTALAAKVRGEGRVTLAFIGEGGTSTGDFHEALNLAASAWVPFVCVVEQNGYAYSTPSARQARIASFAQRASAYGIPGTSVDGNDVLAVRAEVERTVERARDGGGPALIEARTFRMRGHSEADRAEYVPATLLVEWEARDPIAQIEATLRREDWLTDADRDQIGADLHAIVEEAEAFALASPPPDPAELAAHVWADDGSGRIKPRRVRVTGVSARLGPDRFAGDAAADWGAATSPARAARPS
jgi:TPP-dependent pyruvate/acetoin dehydrogenase alpha subunit